MGTENLRPSKVGTATPPDVNDAQRNYPYNCWWVAARSEEVVREPFARWLLELPIVLYRTESGNVVALENRCVHRWAKISSGYLAGDNIVCGYHGAVFGQDGRCKSYPTQATVPDTAKLRAYPIIESDPFIWIWLGDPSKIGHAARPAAMPWFREPDWLTVGGQLPLEANYFLLQENVLDLTHFNYAHRKTFEVTDIPVPSYQQDGDQVSFQLDQRPFDVPAFQRAALGIGDHIVSRRMLGTFVTPALHTVQIDMHDEDAGPNGRSDYKMWVVHCVTPVGPGKTHYWWILAQDFGNGPGAAEAVTAGVHAAFLEDKVIIEGIQETIVKDRRHLDSQEITFAGDMGGLLARRALKRLLAAEHA